MRSTFIARSSPSHPAAPQPAQPQSRWTTRRSLHGSVGTWRPSHPHSGRSGSGSWAHTEPGHHLTHSFQVAERVLDHRPRIPELLVSLIGGVGTIGLGNRVRRVAKA